MRLLIRQGSHIAGLPANLIGSGGEDDMGISMRLAMDAEELPNLVDRIVARIEGTEPMRLDLAMRLRDLLEVRRPTRKARFAPVDGVVVLRPAEGFTRLSLQVDIVEEEVFQVVLSLDDELMVAHGQRVEAGKVLAAGEAYMPDLLQLFGDEAVLAAFELHLLEITRALGMGVPPELPAALAFVRNWMLGWIRIHVAGGLPVPGGTILPAVALDPLLEEIPEGGPRPIYHRHIMGLGRLAERYLGGLSPEA
jgi:hypothetical protein